MSFGQGTSAKVEANIDAARDKYGLSGKGCLAIVMDRGVDYRHPDFIDAEGNTRIAYIYDLYDNTGANDPDNPYGIGTIYDAAEINASLQMGGAPLVNDIYGHGTATTGIMAGNGTAVADPNLFRGVAYDATIISIIVTRDFVPPFNGNPGQGSQFNPNLLPTAFQFAEDKIAAMGMPSVTLLNIGSIGNPTDGSVSFCETVDRFVQNGNPFVCGVGDDGGQDNHAIENLALNQTTTFEIQKGVGGNLRFTAWYDEAARCELTVERPNGVIEGPFSPLQNANGASNHFLDQMNVYRRGANVEFSGSSSNLRQLLIDFSGPTGIYKVHLNTTTLGANTTINGMLNPARFFNTNKFLNFSGSGGNINPYSSCFETISPGDYVANTAYVDVNNIPRNRTGQGNVGELWIGQSVGPTMDGRFGIDFAATGELAVGAYSLDSYYGSFSFNTMQNSNGYYGIQNAVSGAAPIAAGVIALMLEANPALTPGEIKAILQESARADSFTGTVPNDNWGYGKLDALGAVERAIQAGGCPPRQILSGNQSMDSTYRAKSTIHSTASIQSGGSPQAISYLAGEKIMLDPGFEVSGGAQFTGRIEACNAGAAKTAPAYTTTELLNRPVENTRSAGDIEPAAFQNPIRLYPNPARDRVNFEIELSESGPLQITVFDATGRIIRQIDFLDDAKWPVRGEIDLSRVSPGTYYCRLRCEDGVWSQKLVLLGRD